MKQRNHFHFNAFNGRFDGGLIQLLKNLLRNKHQIHLHAGFIFGVKLQKCRRVVFNGHSKAIQQFAPSRAFSAGDNQIKIVGRSRVSMRVNGKASDDKKQDAGFAGFSRNPFNRTLAHISQRFLVDVRMGGGDETLEERMRLVRLAQKFRVELAGNEERMVRQFDDFHQLAVR